MSATKTPLFHVVLHQPEIPNNTGNIGRTCVATRSSLHLIHPLGFDISEKACRRAGLDYWPRLDVREHDRWQAYLDATPASRRWFYTTKTARSVFDADFRVGDHLVFGAETRGLPADILGAYPDRLVRFPMAAEERSLNLATVVCAAVYEALRQCVARSEIAVDPNGNLVL